MSVPISKSISNCYSNVCIYLFKLIVQRACVCICSNIILCVCLFHAHSMCTYQSLLHFWITFLMFCFACLHTRTPTSSPNMHIKTCDDCPLVADVSLSDTRELPQCSLVWSCFVFPPVPRTKGLGLTFTSAHILIRALVDGPGSQPTDTMDHIKCVVRALVPILAVSLPHVCVFAERLDCRHRLALAAGYGHSTGDSRTKRTVHNKLDFNTGDQCPFDTVVLGECHNAYLAPRPATVLTIAHSKFVISLILVKRALRV